MLTADTLIDSSEAGDEVYTSDSDYVLEPPARAAQPAAAKPGPSKQQPLLHVVFGCHRGKAGKDSRQPADKKQIRTKKLGCPFKLRLVHPDRPDTVLISEEHGHFGHTPGVGDDNQWLRVDRMLEEMIRKVWFGCMLSAGQACKPAGD